MTITASYQTFNIFPKAIYKTLQTTKMNYEKLLGYISFKNRKCSPLYSLSRFCPSAPSFVFTLFLFNVLRRYFYEF